MPVDGPDSERVIAAANAVLDRQVLGHALPILVVNQFPPSHRIANFFRRNAAIAGSAGAGLHARIQVPANTWIISKSKPSAFSNAELDALLKENAVQDIYVLGVFAEGCVRSTAADAKRRGYNVIVPTDAIGSNASLKRAFAQWAMRRAGVRLVPTLFANEYAT